MAKILTVSRKKTKILTVNRKSHHPIETLFMVSRKKTEYEKQEGLLLKTNYLFTS